MRRGTRILIACCAPVAVAASLAAYALQTHHGPRADAVAVLELYTSEGCSSCPPADFLLGRLVKESRQTQNHVYPLSFHVDTWNQPAFSDPFSAAEYSRREESYYRQHISDGVYTPQLVINGTKVAVGSDEPVIRAAIAGALQTAAPIALKLNVQRNADELTVMVDLSTLPPGTVLNVALAERGLSNHVRKGENTGLTLEHENVVRVFKTLALSEPHAAVSLTIPHGVVTGNCSVVAYAQSATLAVIGATDAPVPATTASASSQP
jgi:hypothetical protein